MTFTFGGLASGLDSNSIISQLVSLARTPQQAIETRRSRISQAKASVSDLGVKLSTLSDRAAALGSSAGSFASTKAQSSDTTALGATSGAGAVAGKYAIRVTSVAAPQRTYSAGFASSTTAGLVGEGTLTLSGGGATTPTTIAIGAGDSLQDVAQRIQASGGPVSASVVQFDAPGGGTEHKLLLTSKVNGTANAVTFSTTGTVALDLSAAGRTVQAASDAVIEIDGHTRTSASNTIADAIAGVTLQVTHTTTDPVTVEVLSDSSATSAKVKSFIDAYNASISAIHSQTGFGKTVSSNKELAADSTLRGVGSRLARVIADSPAAATGRYRALSEVGIATQRDGTLTLDTTKLESALAADADSVSRLFAGDAQGVGGIAASMRDTVAGIVTAGTGILAGKTSALGETDRRLEKDVAQMERHITAYEDRLRRQYAAMETLVSQYQAQGNQLSARLG